MIEALFSDLSVCSGGCGGDDDGDADDNVDDDDSDRRASKTPTASARAATTSSDAESCRRPLGASLGCAGLRVNVSAGLRHSPRHLPGQARQGSTIKQMLDDDGNDDDDDGDDGGDEDSSNPTEPGRDR